MQNLVPGPIPIPEFTPVPRKYRFDGWTDDRQRAFIVALAETGSVRAACKRLNMSSVGAYCLRRQPGSESFAAAWEAALSHGVQNLADIAFERAIEGVPVPIFYKGEQCGEKRWYNDRLIMFILRHHMPQMYGKLAGLNPGTRANQAEAGQDRADAQEEAEAWLRRHLQAFAAMAIAHRVHLRQAVLSLFAGDHWGAADHEHSASEIEQAMSRPEDWQLEADLRTMERARDDADLARPDHPDWCRQLAEAPSDGVPEPNFPALTDLPRTPSGSLIPRLPLSQAIRAGHHIIQCGPTVREREAARQRAEQRMAEAQLEWIAAYCEKDWAAWKNAAAN